MLGTNSSTLQLQELGETQGLLFQLLQLVTDGAAFPMPVRLRVSYAVSRHPCGPQQLPWPGTSSCSLVAVWDTNIDRDYYCYITMDSDMVLSSSLGWELMMVPGGSHLCPVSSSISLYKAQDDPLLSHLSIIHCPYTLWWLPMQVCHEAVVPLGDIHSLYCMSW